MPFVEEKKALAACFAASRMLSETSFDDPMRSLAERVAEDYRLRYERLRVHPRGRCVERAPGP